MDYKAADRAIHPKPEHLANVKYAGHKTLSGAILEMMAGDKYVLLTDIMSVIGCGSTWFKRYKARMEDYGIKIPDRPSGFEITRKNMTARTAKRKKMSISGLFRKIPPETLAEPQLELFGDVDVFRGIR